MTIVNLINPDGRVNRAAVILDAKRQHRVLSRHGWDWPECLRYSWLRARAMQHNAARTEMENELCRQQDDDAEANC